MMDAPSPEVAAQWLVFLKSDEAQSIYHRFGFRSISLTSRSTHPLRGSDAVRFVNDLLRDRLRKPLQYSKKIAHRLWVASS